MDDLDKAISAFVAHRDRDHAQAQRAVLAIRDWRALGWWRRAYEWIRG
jgi:hypothetical protein